MEDKLFAIEGVSKLNAEEMIEVEGGSLFVGLFLGVVVAALIRMGE